MTSPAPVCDYAVDAHHTYMHMARALNLPDNPTDQSLCHAPNFFSSTARLRRWRAPDHVGHIADVVCQGVG